MSVLERLRAMTLESLRRRKEAWIAIASFLVTMWIPILSWSPTADVSGFYTDHIHHPFATWVAMTRGIESVYRMPFAEAWQGSLWPYPLREWPTMPAMAYPPGVLVLCAPLALLGRFGHLGDHGFAMTSMLFVLFSAHVSLYFVLRLLRILPPGGRSIVGVMLYLQLLEFGLEGFHDSLVFGLAAASLVAAHEKKSALALTLFTSAISLHYRAGAPFAGIGLLLLWDIFKKPQRSRADWIAIAYMLVVGAISVVMLVWSVGAASTELLHLEKVVATTRAQLVIGGALVAYALALGHAKQWCAVFATLGATFLTLTERCPFYWHGAILLAAPLLVGAERDRPSPWRAFSLRIAGIGLFLWLRPVVWNDPADFIVRELIRSTIR